MKVLVTGLSGYLGSYVALNLLTRGFEVRGTVRSEAKEHSAKTTIQSAGVQFDDANLTFVVADLTSDSGWAEATSRCDYVIHVASPFGIPTRSDDDLIIPAVEGTKRVLKFSRDAGVRRTVITSSFGAIGYGHPPNKTRFDEKDWTRENTPGLSAYIRSKTLAERAAWEFEQHGATGMEISVINPTGIFGPVLGPDMSASLQIVKSLLEGKVPACPNIYFGVADVRDVAELHVRAMLCPKAPGQRYICVSGDCIPLIEVARILRSNLGEKAKRVPRRAMPNWVVRLLANWRPDLRATVENVGKIRNASNAKAREELEWTPRSATETIIDTAESMFKLDLIEAA